MAEDTAPVFALRDAYNPDSYWPDEYVASVEPVLERLGFLARPLTDADRQAAERALRGLHDLTLDETDVYPFGLLWALRSTGAVADIAWLDAQLRDWRTWEETDHLAGADFLPPDPLGFLPVLPD